MTEKETVRNITRLTVGTTEQKSDSLYIEYWYGRIDEETYKASMETLRSEALYMVESFEVYGLINKDTEKDLREWVNLIASV